MGFLNGDDAGRFSSKGLQEPVSPASEGKRKMLLRMGSGRSGTGSRRDSSFPPSPMSSSLGEANRRRQEAVAKAQAAKALQLARQQEIRVGEEWSEYLKVPSNRTPDTMLNFWEEVKMRLLKRFGSLHSAIQSSGESSVSFLKFCDLLRVIHFPLNQSTCRHLFGQVCAGHREMPIDSFKALLMERTIQSMRFVMEGWNGKQVRVQSHIRTFIRRLAEVDETHRAQAVDRFQRKLSDTFLRQFWQLLQRLGSSRSDVTVTQSSLLRVLVDPEATAVFQDQEVIYMLRIFERMGRFRQSLGLGSLPEAADLPIRYYLTGLVLVSMIPTKKAKLALLFEAFDSDYDHCLLYSQVHEMCHCICVLKVMVEESARGASDENFQAELSQQEGLRWYETIRWHLQRTQSVQGDIVSLPELCAALEAQPGMLLLPGLVRIRWAGEALPGEDLEEAVAAAAAEQRQAVRGPTRRRPAVDLSKLPVRREEDSLSLDWRSLDANAKGFQSFQSKSESFIFKTVLTSRFAKSLRDLGNQRLVQLTQGFSPEEEHGRRGEEAPAIALDMGLGYGHKAKGHKVSKGKQGPRDEEEVSESRERPSSSPTPPWQKVPDITRASSAPALADPKSAKGPGSPSSKKLRRQDAEVMSYVPQRWGTEAGDRFRIYAAAKTGVDCQDVQKVRQRSDPGQIMPYKCKLCLRLHKLCPGHDLLQ